MLVDVVLAVGHHLLVFALAGLLAAELILVRPGLAGRELKLLARIDQAYGGFAGAVIVVGILRVFFGLKGWEFYVYNVSFWAKMLAFAVVAVLTIAPTVRIVRWRRAAQNSVGIYVVPDTEIAATRRFIHWQALVFLLIPVFAAMMARGIY